jgi:hypothetical protein
VTFYCAGCGNDRADVCLGFAGRPPAGDAVCWYYVGARCCECGRDACFQDGPADGGVMGAAVFWGIAGEPPLPAG